MKYDSDVQFQLAIQPLIKEAIQRIRNLRKDSSSVSRVASYYRRKRKRNYWDLYNGGLAFGLVGDASNASKLLSQFVSMQDDRDCMKAAQAVAGRFLSISHLKESFREEASAQVPKARHLLNLTDLPNIKWQCRQLTTRWSRPGQLRRFGSKIGSKSWPGGSSRGR